MRANSPSWAGTRQRRLRRKQASRKARVLSVTMVLMMSPNVVEIAAWRAQISEASDTVKSESITRGRNSRSKQTKKNKKHTKKPHRTTQVTATLDETDPSTKATIVNFKSMAMDSKIASFDFRAKLEPAYNKEDPFFNPLCSLHSPNKVLISSFEDHIPPYQLQQQKLLQSPSPIPMLNTDITLCLYDMKQNIPQFITERSPSLPSLCTSFSPNSIICFQEKLRQYDLQHDVPCFNPTIELHTDTYYQNPLLWCNTPFLITRDSDSPAIPEPIPKRITHECQSHILLTND